MKRIILAAAAALFLTTFNPPARASESAKTEATPAKIDSPRVDASARKGGWTDRDQDSINDADEPQGCVDAQPIPRGASIQLTGPRAGCWTSPKACIVHRLQFGGGDARSCGALDAPWGEAESEVVRGLDYRLDKGGRLVQVDGTLITFVGGGWRCTDPALYMYSGGKVTRGADAKDAGFTSAFGPEQPPACSHSRLEASASAGSNSRAMALAREARDGLDGLSGKYDESEAAAKEWRKAKDGKDTHQDAELVRVEDESKQRDEDLATVDEEMGKTLVEHKKEFGRIRRHGGIFRIGGMFSGYGIQDGLKIAGYNVHVDPHGGLRLSLGYRYLDGERKLLVMAAVNGDLHGNGGLGGPGTMRGGAGLGFQVGAFGFLTWQKAVALGIGGNVEARGEWYNLTSRDYDVGPVLHSGTFILAPTFGLVGLFGEAKRVGFQLNAGFATAVTGLPDGTKTGTGMGMMPPADIQAMALFRF